jgi:hypothetical protein
MSLIQLAKVAIHTALHKTGYQISRYYRQPGGAMAHGEQPPVDLTERDIAVCRRVLPYTMTSYEQIFSLRRAVEYIIHGRIPGNFVECGAWKGGSSMVMALTLLEVGDTSRHLYLYDTFDAGWPDAISEHDVSVYGETPRDMWVRAQQQGWTVETLFARQEAVRQAMASTGYPMDKVHLIKGKVEDTIPAQAPETIALLRLDTDWYESTWHEMTRLYPRISRGGVLIQDDYGYLKGARKATDEYFAQRGIAMLLHRVNATGYRIGVRL